MSYNPFALEGKVVLVTGASSGIGRATAIECSKMGAMVIATGRDEKRLNETLQDLQGHSHEAIVADLTSDEGIHLLVEKMPKLDGIVNCAGINKNLPYTFVTPENLALVMNVNFFAPAELTRMLIKGKKMEKGASIVFISSVSGTFCSAPASSMYSASKGAINGLVKGMALDLASRKIRVNAICPGVVETHIFDAGTISSEQLEENKKQYPLGRFGKPEEVAYAAIYLLSDATQWITGANLLIDGGLTLQ